MKSTALQQRIDNCVEDAEFTYSKAIDDKLISYYETKYNLIMQDSKQKDLSYNKAILRIRPDFKKLNRYSVYKGEPLKNDNDILVDRFFFKAQKLKLGGPLSINGVNYNVCGILSVPDYIAVMK
ncbi:MAG TPA: hypothetical protein VHT34_09010, partial [Clostridia bacterium]|nr:hypothetical protein [Clostridia bacterium]